MINFFKNTFILSLISTTLAVFGQEEIGPLTGNSKLISSTVNTKVLANSFDSTTIYLSDTLQLPFLDDFSTKKIQKYDQAFSGSGVTSVLKYSLLNLINLPLLTNTKLGIIQGTHKTYDPVQDTTGTVLIPSIPVQYNNLATWPVNYNTLNLFPAYNLIDTLGDPDQDTVFLSFTYSQYSARQFFQEITDPKSLWLDSNAYHNYTFSKDPRTLGMMTFDGVKDNGLPYVWNLGDGLADILTSKPLDLSILTPNDSVYFSFLYQQKGVGEVPEASDKFSLDFFNTTTQLWEQVWFVNGGASNAWKSEHIGLINPQFFQNGFRFRFKNDGALTGILDHWNLDYVHLRKLSGISDSIPRDFAIVAPIPTLLKTYTSVPWDHYKASPANRMANQTEITVRNVSLIDIGNSQPGLVQIEKNNISLGNFVLPSTDLTNFGAGGTLNYDPNTSYSHTFDFSTGYSFDPSTLGNTATFDYYTNVATQFVNIPINDTTFGKQVFEDYYAYDDGSAEAAYGVTGAQGQLAYRFDPYIGDSLIGIKMHWAASVKDVRSKLFFIVIREDNGGTPGNVIYQDDAFSPRSPVYGDEKNQFVDYYLKDTMRLKINGPFFIGWKQVDADRLNIGFDKNTNSLSNVYYSNSNGASWTQSTIPGSGSLMMRPIYSTASNQNLSLSNGQEFPEVTIYPNPFDTQITVISEISDFNYKLIDLNGRIIKSGEQKIISTEELNSGMYLLQIFSKDQMIFTTSKIIKK